MLVLTRKLNDRIRIGGTITVTVVEGGRGRVRLGIEAPKELRISREDRKDHDEHDESGNDR